MTSRSPSPSRHPKNKPCTICQTARPVLVRCQIDETGKWHFVCPGKCWKSVSGGEVDAKGHESDYPYYRYGGMWKNKHAGVSAKKPKRKMTRYSASVSEEHDPVSKTSQEPTRVNRKEIARDWRPGVDYVQHDRIKFAGKLWVCRRSHFSGDEDAAAGDIIKPTHHKGYRWWKEDDLANV